MAAPMKKSVELGFVEKNDSWRLKSRYFPSKVGGKPSWLHLSRLPDEEELRCASCGRPLTFLLQIYAPSDDLEEEEEATCFHRTLFLFFCEAAACCRPNESSDFVSFRCQLSRKNEFYDYEPPKEDENETKPLASDFVRLCFVCGAKGGKKCAVCGTSYCSKEHQITDWKNGHKEICKTITASEFQDGRRNLERIPEYEIVTEREPSSEDDGNINNLHNSATSCSFSETRKDTEPNQLDSKDLKDLEEMSASHNDKQFSKFQKRIALDPDQVIRYQKGGNPLWVSSVSIPDDRNVPNCDNCGAKRQFEFQVLPQLLNYLKLDDLKSSVDWGTIVVYTCSRNCTSDTKPYLKEFVYKQDFSQGDQNLT